jgi:D-alanyl-D-alanine carboxypeptidase (penicillin-binding protein 5/6)
MAGAVLVAAGSLAGAPPAWGATPVPTIPPPPPAKAMLLVDVTTGRELYGVNEHVILPPASLTKILTAMVASDWLPPRALVPVSARAAGVYPDRVGMKAGQRWPLTVALHALLISSANDAAYALAERVGLSVERFGTIMGAAAAELGMTDHPVLRDPAGLDGTEGAGGGNLMSAWDVAIASRDLMGNRALASIVAMKSFRFTGPDGIVYVLGNHNRAFLNSYQGAIGVKTGYTVRAGVCVAEAAVRGGRTMLAIVMNGVNPDQTAAMLLDKGFTTPVAAEKHDPVLPTARQPEPVRPAPPRISTVPVPSVAPVVRPVAVATTVAARHHPGVIPGPAIGAFLLAAAGAVVLVAGLAVRRFVIRLTRPGGAETRR